MSNLTKTYDAEIPCLRPISNGVKRIIVAMSGGVDSSVAAAL
ncbi:tRNA 2-thiouridine(34) synthase MnmA, partial [Patescibacteria group bacterium]|nr:tRNA 2-thiouridine(34) synthase MnmA [Patescibacteria group bacterium]